MYVTSLPCLVAIGDITYLNCHMTFPDHAIKGSYDKLLIVCNHYARFDGHRHCGNGDITCDIMRPLVQRAV